MKAFIVSSPYQVLNSLQLFYSFKDEADIFVLDQFAGCLSLVNNLRESKTFRKVIKVKNMTYKGRKRIKEFIDRNFLYFFKAAGSVGGCVYDQVFFAALDLTVYMLMKCMKKINSNLVLYRMEDGAGDYISDGFMYSSITDTYLHKIIGGNVFLAERETEAIRKNTYLYEPKLINDKGRSVYIKKLQNNLIYKDFLEKINRIFKFQKRDIPTGKILFFDAAATYGSIKNMDENLKDVIQLLNKTFGENEVSIKLHPRRKENIYYLGSIWGYGNVPAEIYFANMLDDLSQKIIIGPFSTTSLTPKTIFGAEPYIISLHKILYDKNCFFTEEDLPKCEKVLKELDSLYGTKEKIYVPGDMAQLEAILRRLI